VEMSSVNFIHLLDLTRNSCEKYNYRPSGRNRNCGLAIPLQRKFRLACVAGVYLRKDANEKIGSDLKYIKQTTVVFHSLIKKNAKCLAFLFHSLLHFHRVSLLYPETVNNYYTI
jgi:hypothetical protein